MAGANADRIAELKQGAIEAINIAETATDDFERREAEDYAEKLVSEMERLQAIDSGLIRGPNRVQAAVESATSEGSIARDVANLGTDIVGGAIKGTAGLLSLPYELPALLAAGAESAAEKLGYDYDTPEWLRQGQFYQFLAGEWGHRQPQTQLGIAMENIGEAAVEMSPTLAAGPVVYGYAVTAELTRKQLADSIRPYGPDAKDQTARQYTTMALESIPLGGPELGAVTATIPFKKSTPQLPKEKKVTKEKREQLGPTGKEELQAAQEAGFELTIGQSSGDKVELALENHLRGTPEGGVIVDLDIRNANRVPEFIYKAYDLVKNPKLSGAQLRTALTNAYEAYKKGRQESFKKLTQEKFNALPDDVTFDVTPILAKIDELRAKYQLDETTVTSNPIVNALDRLKKSLQETETRTVVEYVPDARGIRRAVKKQVEVPVGGRALTPQQIQKHLQDIGEMAFNGSNPAFADVAPGITRAIGKELGISFKGILDEAAGSGDAAAIALKDARDFYNRELGDMKVWGDIPFIQFMDKSPGAVNAPELIATVKQVGDLEIPIVRQLLEKEAPDLIPQIRKSLIEDIVTKNQTLETRGSSIEAQPTVNVRGLLEDLADLQKNNEWFKGDASVQAIQEIKSIMPIVERTLAQQGVPIVIRTDIVSKIARINSELQGVIFGTAGRYTAQVGERVAETAVTILQDPRALANAAVTPGVAPAVRKAVRKQRMSQAEMKKFNAWAMAYRLQLVEDLAEEGRRREAQERNQ